MFTATATITSTPENSIRVYKYRWVIIGIFFLYVAVNYFQTMQFTIISDVVIDYYEVDSFLVDCSALVFYVCYIPIFGPIGYIVEKTSLKTTSLVATGLTAIGAVMKIFVASPDRYYLVMISQVVCAIGQCFMVTLPSVTACAWFGAEQVSTACALGLFGTQIGLALSMTIPSLTVKASKNKDDVTSELNTLFIYNAALCVGVFIVVLIFFRSKPPQPPSQSQAEVTSKETDEKTTFWSALKGFVKNKDFLIVLLTLGSAYGIWASFGVVINQIYTHYIPNGEGNDVAVITFAAVISGGCFGNMLFGAILDRTHHFKFVSFSVLLANTLATIAQAIALELGSRVGAFIAIPINGFFGGSLMVLAYEYIAETTYPIPEAYGATVLNISIASASTILVLILDLVFEYVGYYMGYVIMVVCLTFSTLCIYFISPELRRRNANMAMKDEEFHIGHNENTRF